MEKEAATLLLLPGLVFLLLLGVGVAAVAMSFVHARL